MKVNLSDPRKDQNCKGRITRKVMDGGGEGAGGFSVCRNFFSLDSYILFSHLTLHEFFFPAPPPLPSSLFQWSAPNSKTPLCMDVKFSDNFFDGGDI